MTPSVPAPVIVAVIDSGADVAAPAVLSVVTRLAATVAAVFSAVIVAESAPATATELPAAMYEVEVPSAAEAAFTVTVHVTSEFAEVATPEPSVE